jgi:branched-chain amino acid aminotransferase
MPATKLDIAIESIPAQELKGGVVKGQDLKFGKTFSDRMFIMRYTPRTGWIEPAIKKYGSFEISPAATVLHYAQEIFEGLKAYKRIDGSIGLFRPRDNFKRMNVSAERLCLPTVDVDFALDALRQLLVLEKNWVPQEEGASLYIRPTMIGVDPYVGLRSSEECLFYMILSPVGMYYANGFKPTKIMVEEDTVRAVRGGLGAAKTGANYAASLYAGVQAAKKGFDQVLWLDGVERRYVEEVGSMNIFFMYGDKLVTSALNGSILAGITRDSVLQIAKSWKLNVAEKPVDVHELVADIKSGKVTEVFGSGTAAVISPVGLLRYQGHDYQVADGGVGKFTQKFYDYLTGIQYGKEKDQFGWTEIIG